MRRAFANIGGATLFVDPQAMTFGDLLADEQQAPLDDVVTLTADVIRDGELPHMDRIGALSRFDYLHFLELLRLVHDPEIERQTQAAIKRHLQGEEGA